ncbi:methyltransferase small domain-containing protein [Rutstroemia sp. NJR-2017a WRK4]|nr:methyltransferase small domain-containing protein [Rutstroemia sp. NJR-2017a WRK4]
MSGSSTPSKTVQSLSTADLYNRWASKYDTDGNPLQALDSRLMPTLITALMGNLSKDVSRDLTVTELGCGTGRNTVLFLRPPLAERISQIYALDLSHAMLDIARSYCSSIIAANPGPTPKLEFHEFNAMKPEATPEITRLVQGKADIVLSTLVLEHLPLSQFFSAVTMLLKSDEGSGAGKVLITNMHAEMGRLSQAGFDDEVEGKPIKIRGESFVYEVEEVIEEGRLWGFEVVNEVMEKAVEEGDVDEGGNGLRLGNRGRKWVGKKMWFGMVMERKREKI